MRFAGNAEAVVLNAFVVEDPIIPYQCTGTTVRSTPNPLIPSAHFFFKIT
jgi:hypothetical protein